MKYTRTLLIALLAAGAAPTLDAQTVFRPPAPLDSAHAAVRDAVLIFRDSLQLVHASGARLRRDFHGASSAALVSRARSLRDGCNASLRGLPSARASFASAPVSSPRSESARSALLTEMDRLEGALKECRATFGEWVRVSDAEAVRGYGNRRAADIRTAIQAYENRVKRYLGHQNIRIRPLGAGPSPIRS